MRHEPPVRDRNASIWQSAKFDNVYDRTTRRNKKPAPWLKSTRVGPQAGKSADFETSTSQLASKIRGWIARYSTWDLVGWVQCEWQYLRYMIEARFPQYNDWTKQPSPSLSYGMIEYRLPSTCKVVLIGDWGTHMTDNVALLRQALKKFRPDAIIHLGDVYYSGTPQECTRNVLEVMDDLIDELKIKRPPFFTLPGNHDYYSGGRGFYQTIRQINSSLPRCQQPASYFCLRTEDDRWQFLGMDTGYNDRDPIKQKAPGLVESEIRWHQDKLNHFNGTTVLLSHHQLFSSKEVLSKGARPWLNESLQAIFQPYYDQVAAWFWGHEHNLILFKDSLPFTGDIHPLRKGRLVGCSAYEETIEELPYSITPACKAAEFMEKMPQLQVSKYRSDLQKFYDHAFAMLDVSPERITASYYAYPSWDQDFSMRHEPEIAEPLFRETLLPVERPAKPPA
jgi:predicted phosphodiesterase